MVSCDRPPVSWTIYFSRAQESQSSSCSHQAVSMLLELPQLCAGNRMRITSRWYGVVGQKPVWFAESVFLSLAGEGCV